MFPITTKLAGVTYDDAQDNIKRFGCEEIGTFELVREANNPHDLNAIKVRIGPYHLGYVSKHIAKSLAPKMDSGRRFGAEFAGRNEHTCHETVGLTVRIVEVSQPNIEECRPL